MTASKVTFYYLNHPHMEHSAIARGMKENGGCRIVLTIGTTVSSRPIMDPIFMAISSALVAYFTIHSLYWIVQARNGDLPIRKESAVRTTLIAGL